MGFFKRKEDESERLFNSFAKKMKREGFDLIILDKNKIKDNYGQGLYHRLYQSLHTIDFKNFSFIFDEKELRISWPSDYYLNRIVINLVHGPGTSEFINAIQGAKEELQQIELALGGLKPPQI